MTTTMSLSGKVGCPHCDKELTPLTPDPDPTLPAYRCESCTEGHPVVFNRSQIVPYDEGERLHNIIGD